MSNLTDYNDSDIAVVGMACHFPDAKNYNEFWENLVNGKESVTFFSDEELRKSGVEGEELNNPSYVKAGVVLQDLEMFDAPFFGLSPKEASIMDPQHRHFLECSWEALEDAGYVPDKFNGPIGIFGGCGMNAYFMFNLLTNPKLVKQTGLFLLRHTGNDKDFLTTRVSYNFNLTGPSVSVQTACSTSLVAIHVAVQSLLNGECDLALAGGVTIELPHRKGYLFEEGEILSNDGHCRAFDHKSKGTIFGSGAGVVVLKRFEEAFKDGDNIHAVIKSTAINNDGSLKVGYFAPSVDGQAQAISEAIAVANINPETITYVETHGTGTFIGDPIEVTALTQSFRRFTDKKGFCRIGSVKSNIGHLDTAAGIASFIKTVLSLKHKKIPPSINFEKPNPNIDFDNSPFFVNTNLTDWTKNVSPLRAGVSSLGVGGTNAHVIVEEAPISVSSTDAKPWQILTMSAKTKSSLANLSEKIADFLADNNKLNLADAAYTLQMGRKSFPHRQILVSKNSIQAAEKLKSNDNKNVLRGFHDGPEPSVVFMFPGGGAQYPNMGIELYEQENVYKEAINNCLNLLKTKYEIDLRSLMFPENNREEFAALELQKPMQSILSIFIVEYALAKLWTSYAVKPKYMIGHSMGEYAAACISGIMSLEDALDLVVLRGKIFERLPEGGMLSVNLPEEVVKQYTNENLSIAVINGQELCVLSGNVNEVNKAEKRITEDGFDCTRVKISVAAHSQMLDPYLDEFREGISKIKLNTPSIPIVSNVSGNWISNEEAVSTEYWVTQLRNTVRFSDGLRKIMNDSNLVFLETGPGNTLSSLVRGHQQKSNSHYVISSLRHPQENISDHEYFYKSVGNLWISGVNVKWKLFHSGERRKRISLPTYAFDHQPYWIEPGKLVQTENIEVDPLKKIKNVKDWFSKPVWKHTDNIAHSEKKLSDNEDVWLILNHKNNLGPAIFSKLKSFNQKAIIVSSGSDFRKKSDSEFVINTAKTEDYSKLIDELSENKSLPSRIIHLLGVYNDVESDEFEKYDDKLNDNFFSHLFLVQALGNEDLTETVKWITVTNGMHKLDYEDVSQSVRSVSLGPMKTIRKEFPQINTLSIDFEQKFDAESISDMLLSEFNSDFEDQVIAYRKGLRFVNTFEKFDISKDAKLFPLLKYNGVYIITGGTGGIATTLSRSLAKLNQPRLILLSRKNLPDRSDWNHFLEASRNQNSVVDIINNILELEKLGAEVSYFKIDVTNKDGVESIFQKIYSKYGTIDGIIHAAGTIDDGVIMFKKKEDAAAVLDPKVKGTLILYSLAKKYKSEFLILFSSASSILAPTGQIDYSGANAFMDTFANANYNPEGLKTIAINWGQWQEVGMAARIAQSLGIVEESFKGEKSTHPLLGIRTKSDAGEIEFNNKIIGSDYWILNEHQNKQGDMIVPGTAYLEMAFASFLNGTDSKPVEIIETFFLRPIIIKNGEKIDLKIHLKKDDDNFRFLIQSRTNPFQSEWDENASGTIKRSKNHKQNKINIDSIKNCCGFKEDLTENSINHKHMSFGSRWKNIRELYFGNNEGIALIELPSEYISDLNSYNIHPALFDSATGCAQALTGYDLENEFYLPFSYSKIIINNNLPRTFYSHIRYKPTAGKDSNTAIFQITIYDLEGNEIIDIKEFVMKRLTASNLNLNMYPKHYEHEKMIEGSHNPVNPKSTGNRILQLGQKEGILPSEGVEVFNMILNHAKNPQYIVVSQELSALNEQINNSQVDENQIRVKSTPGENQRPKLSTEYVPPKTEIEKGIAEIWQEILGVNSIGINDDFLELGGHSLLLTRIIMKLRKKFNVDLSLSNLFETPTIKSFSLEVEKALSVGVNTQTSEITPVSREHYRIN